MQVDQHPVPSLKDTWFGDPLVELASAPRDVIEDGKLYGRGVARIRKGDRAGGEKDIAAA